MSNRWKIILIATLFNLLFEYSIRGINNLKILPFLPLLLFLVYFTLYIMLEDLIVRYKLKSYHLLILSFAFGTIYMAVFSGAIFAPPLVLGINWGMFIYVNLIWWGALQTVLTFYIANLIVRRDWNHPKMTVLGWAACIIIQLITIRIFQAAPTPHGTPLGNVVVLLIASLFTIISIFILRKRRNWALPNPFTESKFLNFLSFFTIAVLAFTAIFLTKDPTSSLGSLTNKTSTLIVTRYTLMLAIALLGYRIFAKREIPV